MTYHGVLIPTTNRADWLTKRREGIGASDVAAILGLSPYGSPFTVWAEKTQGWEAEESESMHFGRVLEDVVVDEFTQSKGLHVGLRESLVHHPDFSWARATIDGLVFETPDINLSRVDIWGAPLGVYEGKTDGSWSRWSEIPDHIALQVNWQMFVTGLDHCWIACLHGGRRFEVYEVEYDKTLADTVLERVGEWRDRFLVGDETPEPDGSDATTGVIRGLYPTSGDEVIELSAAMAADVDALRAVKLEAKRVEAEQKRLENRVKVALQEASVGTVGGVPVVEWPQITAHRVDTKQLEAERPDIYEKYLRPSTYRRFLIKEAK